MKFIRCVAHIWMCVCIAHRDVCTVKVIGVCLAHCNVCSVAH